MFTVTDKDIRGILHDFDIQAGNFTFNGSSHRSGPLETSPGMPFRAISATATFTGRGTEESAYLISTAAVTISCFSML